MDDTIPIFQSVLGRDVPDYFTKQSFCVDVVAKFKEEVDKCDNSDLKLEFNRIYDLLQSQGHITEDVRKSSIYLFVII